MAFLMDELAATKRSLAQREEEMRQMEERLQRLEIAQVRQPRRWEEPLQKIVYIAAVLIWRLLITIINILII